MAARTCVICGNFAMSWQDLARACRVQIRQELPGHGHSALQSIDNTRRKRIKGKRDLYDTVFISYMFDRYTDPRDKIYAMTSPADPLPKACLTFDFIRSTEEIYLRFAVEIVFDGTMTETCMGRRVVVLNDCVIGLALAESWVGDLVCCFENTKLTLIPFVIRCQGNSYHLIGQSSIAALSNSERSSFQMLAYT